MEHLLYRFSTKLLRLVLDSKESKPKNRGFMIVALILSVVALCLAVYFYLSIPSPGDNGNKAKAKEVMGLRVSAADMIKVGHFDQGIASLSRALALSPADKLVLMDRAAAHYKNHDYQASLNDYQAVLGQKEEANSIAEDALFGQAMALSALDRNEQAISSLHKLQEKNKHFIRAYQLLGDIYLKGKDSEAAIDAYTQGLRVNAKSPVLYYDRAVAYLRRDMNDQALADMTKAVELDKKSLSLRLKHANLAQKMNKMAVADSDAQEILRIEPDNRSALEWLKKRKIAPLMDAQPKK